MLVSYNFTAFIMLSSCFKNYMISQPALLFFSHRVCNMHGTGVDVVCVPWVTCNRDIIGHYCPLLSMVNDQYMSSSNLNKIAAYNHCHPEWTRIDCVCLKHRKQQQIANFPQLRKLLLLLYVFYILTFLTFFSSSADTQQFVKFPKVSPLVKLLLRG